MSKPTAVQIGQRVGDLVIQKRVANSRHGHARFLCQCSCGEHKEVNSTHLVRKNITHCGCKRPKKDAHYKWSGCGELDGNHWNQIVRNATGKKNRNPIEILITIEDAWDLFLQQDRKCALSGIEIKLGTNRTASLDRIDSSKGYVLGNIQWVHKDINKMKNVFDQDHFIALCKAVAKNA